MSSPSRGGEGGGKVFEEERKAEAVVDAEVGEDVEIVLGTLVWPTRMVSDLKTVWAGYTTVRSDVEVGGLMRGEAEN